MMSNILTPIPWTHDASEFGSLWRWENHAFLVTVNGDKHSFYWVIADKSAEPNASPRPLADGNAATFEQAERSVRETIGKAYPPAMGFQHYAGNLATTFTIGTGASVDLGVFEGRKVTVAVANPEGPNDVYEGTARVQHYDLILVVGEEALRISPSYIMEIRPLGYSGRPMRPVAGAATQQQAAPSTGMRTIQGRLEPGCSGVPGFLPGTVDHRGPQCPIHEESQQRPLF